MVRHQHNILTLDKECCMGRTATRMQADLSLPQPLTVRRVLIPSRATGCESRSPLLVDTTLMTQRHRTEQALEAHLVSRAFHPRAGCLMVSAVPLLRLTPKTQLGLLPSCLLLTTGLCERIATSIVELQVCRVLLSTSRRRSKKHPPLLLAQHACFQLPTLRSHLLVSRSREAHHIQSHP